MSVGFCTPVKTLISLLDFFEIYKFKFSLVSKKIKTVPGQA